MKAIIFGLLAILSSQAFADQVATLTCKNRDFILEEKSPYLGENSRFSQRLFVLKSKENDKETKNTAFFLNIEEDVGKFGAIHISAKNEVGGNFYLITSHPVQNQDSVTIRQELTSREFSYHDQD